MKCYYLTIMVLLLAIFAFIGGGCKVDGGLSDDPPTVDVTAVWLGSWEGENGAETGKLMLNLIQSGSTLSGHIGLYNDWPSLANGGAAIKGKVAGNKISFDTDSSNLDHHYTATVEGGTIRDGVIKYWAKKGTWTADKLPTQMMDIAATITPPCQYPDHLTFDGHSLLVGDLSTSTIYKLDTSGNLLGSIHSECSLQCGIAAEGDTIFTIDGSPRIYLISATDGKKKDQVSIPFDVEAFTCAPGAFFAVKFMTDEIYELTRQGAIVRKFDNNRYVSYLAFDGQSPSAFYQIRAIVKFGQNGSPVSACSFTLPVDKKWIITGGLAFDGECFWIVVEDTVSTPPLHTLLRLRPI